MTFSQHLRAVLVLGLPLIGSHLAQFAIGLFDTIMLGWYGVTELAASVLANSFFFVIFIMGAGFAFAVMPMVAEASSGDDDTTVRRVTRMGMWLSVIYAALFLPLMIWSKSVFLAFGQDPGLSQMAQDYLRIAGFGLFPALLIMVLKSYLAALERTQVVLWITLLAVAVNAFGNWVLIFGNLGVPEMGLKGAAIASATTHLVAVLALALYVAKAPGTRAQVMFQRIWRPDPEVFGRVFRLGWPIGLTNLAESSLFSASALIIGLIGTVPLAAHGIAIQIASGTFMIHLALGQAATVRAGRALGRRDFEGMWRGGSAAVSLSMFVVALTMIAFLTVPELLISGFIDPDEPARGAILAMGTTLLAVAGLFQLVDAGQVMALSMLRGIQDTRVPMIMAAIAYWLVGLPTAYFLGIVLQIGPVGVWLGLVAGLFMASALLWWRFVQRFRAMSSPALSPSL
ncbi:MATE family efflux transporter [Litoreibacter roseus]|uniref:Multidrug-efflux transporter n=1 Tax=Litoreibacter roseus TaxID=2601869 RepID=A0A6N6JLG3_9RHOB|nr:MATE family efflux transporter [Litoreibacter roseus]GFE66022.1 MATE family efflux transporter [Litoreibacter roseus]